MNQRKTTIPLKDTKITVGCSHIFHGETLHFFSGLVAFSFFSKLMDMNEPKDEQSTVTGQDEENVGRMSVPFQIISVNYTLGCLIC